MTTDDVVDEEEAAAGHYEQLARGLLRGQLREFRDDHLTPTARELESSLEKGEPTAREFSAFASKAAEYAEVSADILTRTGDMKNDHPALLLYIHGAEVFSSLTKAGEWFTLDDDGKAERSRPGRDSGPPAVGTPARAAYTLRRVWRILDDVAEEAGEPLPEELRPPPPDVDDEPGGGERC